MPTRARQRMTTTPRPARRVTRQSTTNPSKMKIEVAMGRGVRQVKRTATKMVRATGTAITNAKKRLKRAAARQRLKQKVRKAGAAMKEVGKAAVVEGLGGAADRGAQIIRG